MSILIYRNEQQEGPYDSGQIAEGLASGYFSPEDYAFTEGCSEWVPLRTLVSENRAATASSAERTQSRAAAAALPADRIDAVLAKFLGEEQDPKVVEKILSRVKELLTSGEDVAYIAIQKKPVLTIAPDAILLTNKRFMIVKPKLTGMTFSDVAWRVVKNVHMSEQMMGATITCETTEGQRMAIDSIPKKQARRIYSYAQEVEERMVEERRNRDMEERRAAAGGVVFQGFPGASPQQAQAEDPMAVLGKLKQMLDAGLISAGEFEAKKADVLSKM
jgi:hypothetical protein